MKCPGCDGELEKGRLYKNPIRRCPSCDGILVVQRCLEGILNAISVHHFKNMDIHFQIDPLPSKTESRMCPTCDSQMEVFGYMGTNKVVVDSCYACKHLYLDKLELGAMAALYSKTNKVSEWRKTERASYQSDMVTIHVINEIVNRAFLTGYMLG